MSTEIYHIMVCRDLWCTETFNGAKLLLRLKGKLNGTQVPLYVLLELNFSQFLLAEKTIKFWIDIS